MFSQISVWATPASTEEPAQSVMDKLNVSVCQLMEEMSVRLVSSVYFHIYHSVYTAGCVWVEKQGKACVMSVSFPCEFLFYFTDLEQCEPGWDKFHGFCYRHFGQRLSWEVAEQHCRMLGAHLVSIMTPEEQSYINSGFRSLLFVLCE